jgi:hypothetical protein
MENADDSRFCRSCGVSFRTDEQLVNVNTEEQKSLKGGGVGFVLAFFFGLIGLVLCLLLGDEKCRKTAIKTFIIVIVVGFIMGIILVSMMPDVLQGLIGIYY